MAGSAMERHVATNGDTAYLEACAKSGDRALGLPGDGVIRAECKPVETGWGRVREGVPQPALKGPASGNQAT